MNYSILKYWILLDRKLNAILLSPQILMLVKQASSLHRENYTLGTKRCSFQAPWGQITLKYAGWTAVRNSDLACSTKTEKQYYSFLHCYYSSLLRIDDTPASRCLRDKTYVQNMQSSNSKLHRLIAIAPQGEFILSIKRQLPCNLTIWIKSKFNMGFLFKCKRRKMPER